MTSRADAVAEAGAVLARALAALEERSPREAAEAAHVPGGPSVAALENEIRRRRGLPAAA